MNDRRQRFSFRSIAVAACLSVMLVGAGLLHVFRPPRVLNAQPVPAFAIPHRAKGAQYLSFLVVGDVGHPGRTLEHVAHAMSQEALRESSQFVLLLGDNFYDQGVKSVDDRQWQDVFERPFNEPGLQIPFYAILGNHDYNGNPDAEVDYSASSQRWRMPDRYYALTESIAPGIQARFIGIDTEQFLATSDAGVQQRHWLEQQLDDPSIKWKFVFGHRPILSGSRPRTQLSNVLEPMLLDGEVSVYFSGHDHHQALMRGPASLFQVIAGAGSEARDTAWNAQTVFADADPGFVSCRLSAESLLIKFINAQGEVAYARELPLER